MEKEKSLKNEADRLNELRSYEILDTLSEKDYDDIVTMASIICDVPVALISFVDENRQWFKSHHGLPESETPREYSFCAHAIQEPDQAFVIPDARLDERFAHNPLVTDDPNIVFYAGIPLVNKNGFGLGTVCVIDTKPRELSEKQLKALKILSDQVLNLLELHKVNSELKVLNDELNASQSALQQKNDDLGIIGQGLQVVLDKHISDRVREVAAQNVELDKANKELQAFTYISSHDLQEPLRKIQTFSSFIADKELPNLSEKGQQYFMKINLAAERMSALIRDLLAYSRTTESEILFERMSVSEITEDVIVDLEDEIRERKATVKLFSDCVVDVIQFQFRQVIYNLISNALKFAKPDGFPEIEITCDVKVGSEIGISQMPPNQMFSVISIADKGIGFDNQYNEKIFGLFQRLESRELTMGTGIGLAIVKKIVENHKGFVSALSVLDEGTTFQIYLPIRDLHHVV